MLGMIGRVLLGLLTLGWWLAMVVVAKGMSG